MCWIRGKWAGVKTLSDFNKVQTTGLGSEYLQNSKASCFLLVSSGEYLLTVELQTTNRWQGDGRQKSIDAQEHHPNLLWCLYDGSGGTCQHTVQRTLLSLELRSCRAVRMLMLTLSMIKSTYHVWVSEPGLGAMQDFHRWSGESGFLWWHQDVL